MEPVDKTAEELAAETWPDEERMERTETVGLTLAEALNMLDERDASKSNGEVVLDG